MKKPEVNDFVKIGEGEQEYRVCCTANLLAWDSVDSTKRRGVISVNIPNLHGMYTVSAALVTSVRTPMIEILDSATSLALFRSSGTDESNEILNEYFRENPQIVQELYEEICGR